MNDKIEILKEVLENIQELIKNNLDSEVAQRELNNIQEFENFRTSLLSESDRGSVLMAAAFLENKISHLLKSYMVYNETIQKKIFEGTGALATFSSKIDMSFLLGLIPKNIYNDLGVLRKLRNDFAHNAKSITFQTDYIKDRCKNLKVINKVALRDDTKAYFLRSMTTILTYINIKIDSFERCREEDEFEPAILNRSMEVVANILKK